MRVNKRPRNIVLCVVAFTVLIFAAARISSAQTKTKTAPELHACSLLTVDDVVSIVGLHSPSQETHGGTTCCMWGDTGRDPNRPRLLIQTPTFAHGTRDPLDGVGVIDSERMQSSFKANRKQAFEDKTAQAKDEPQLGKNAFSALTDDGVEIIILKKSCLLNVHYMTGKRGTPENIDAIRKVTAKVSASL